MDLKGKKLEDLVVTLPLSDGSELNCSVYAVFDLNDKSYMALQPLLEDNTPDPSMSLMLYGVTEDEEGNPVVIYIEDDYEYALAAQVFSNNFLK